MSRATLRPSGPLRGACTVSGDKSITQRLILLGALARGTTRIEGGNEGADARAALGIVKALGVPVRATGAGSWTIRGGALKESDRVLDARNSGTALRLSMGMLAAQPFFSVLTGDASLRRRPLSRVIEPLRALGADLSARDQDRLAPVAIRGRRLHGASVRTPVASAQVKSALLLAAIQAEGDSMIEEAAPTRDHTERLLPRFGAPVTQENGRIAVRGPASLQGIEARVPGDFSAAAFLWAAAAIVPRSDVTVRGVGVNPTRRAFLDLLARAGAQVDEVDRRDESDEPVADVRVRAHALEPIHVDPDEARGMIDELPLAAVLAAFAKGESVIRGAEELRVKESDRIATVAAGLRAIGVPCEERPDGWVIQGTGAPRGGSVVSEGDHRIAMAFLVAGLRAKDGVRVEGVEAAAVSDPGFLPRLKGLLR
ncbi:MAG TPA: 3-phosphoshikimate 1-carboxyvinyltransferase [Candidatus Eisenbacteria bacterium]|nr:3-phosphoshikimate 1-carboxyvinyltransferase [Candidatus Eisenbacteria bacterium]